MLQSVKNVVANDPIHYRSVQCDGTETELSDCSFSDFTNNCDHNFDVAVTCKSGEHYVSGRHYVSILPISHTDTATSGFTNDDVRLLGSRDDGKGVVEYYDRFYGWTGVCADSSTEWLDAAAAATIVCRQLGYEGGTTYTERYDRNILLIISSHPFPSSCRDSNVVSALESLIVTDLSCDSSDVHLSDCARTAVTSCSVAGGVECSRTSKICCKMKAL